MKQCVDAATRMLVLVALALTGCSSSSDGGSAGTGGSAGMGGSGGMGGSAGTAGTGGSELPPTGVWTGSGEGSDGSFSICFVVNDEGTALVRPLVSSPGSTCSTDPTYSFAVEFQDCEGALLTTEEIPIADGTFELVNEEGGLAGYWIISGTIDGSSASGEATVGDVSGGTCTGTWEATLSE